jgi:predicted amidophosphoribosyltransferase
MMSEKHPEIWLEELMSGKVAHCPSCGRELKLAEPQRFWYCENCTSPLFKRFNRMSEALETK